jgi:hypothetical protein
VLVAPPPTSASYSVRSDRRPRIRCTTR